MSKGYKGGNYEREVCKLLSMWWTQNETPPRDDAFWRSSQSGGRATQRAKFGKKTYGSYGDISAIDPIGTPLLQLLTLELKRGSSHNCAGDLLDFKEANSAHPWIKCLIQAETSHEQAGSVGWALIARRDHRQGIIYISHNVAGPLSKLVGAAIFKKPPYVRFKLKTRGRRFDFVGMRLEDFLSRVSPAQIMQCLEMLT